MTDDERYIVQGRTRDALRDAKKNLAVLEIEIEEYAKKLEDAGQNLRHFLSHPTAPGPTGMSSLQYTLHFFGALISSDIERKLREFERESGRVCDLQKKVKEFDG
jgi:hypothetical protein